LQSRGSTASGSSPAHQAQGQLSHHVPYLSSTLGGTNSSSGGGPRPSGSPQGLPQQQGGSWQGASARGPQHPAMQSGGGVGPALASPSSSGGVTRPSTASNVSGSSGLSTTSISSWSRGLGQRVGGIAGQQQQDSLAAGMQQLHISGHRPTGR